MAEAVFQRLVDEAGLTDQIVVDSAGTGAWHVGEKAHVGTRQVLRAHGVGYNGRSRQIAAPDMQNKADYIIAMDMGNLRDIGARFGEHPHLYRLLDFATQTNERDVPDPYHTGNFEHVYQLVSDGCRGLLQTIRQREKI
jgi:protein-tyrosine phosphatase